MEAEEQKPVPPTVQSNPPVSQLTFTDTPKEPEITPEDLIPEDIDDEIPELPIEEAKELYDIYFVIAPADMSAPAIQKKNGGEAQFETREEALEAIRKNKLPEEYVPHEVRSPKPTAVEPAPATLSME